MGAPEWVLVFSSTQSVRFVVIEDAFKKKSMREGSKKKPPSPTRFIWESDFNGDVGFF